MVIFNDMSLLFDTTVADLKAHMQREKESSEKIISKVQTEAQLAIKAQEDRIVKAMGTKVTRIEKFMDNLVYDIAKL